MRVQVAVQRRAGNDGQNHRRREEYVALVTARDRNAENRPRRHVEAVAAAQRRRLDQQAEHDHRKREAQHREKNTAVAGEQKPQYQRDDHGNQQRRQQHGRGIVDARRLIEQRRRIRAEAVVEALAERHQPGAHQQHQAEDDQTLGQRQRDQEHQPLRHERHAGEQRGGGAQQHAHGAIVHIRRASGVEKSPFGRAISTIAITE